MTEIDFTQKGFKLVSVFTAAALATFLLFVVMLALISTSFERRKVSTTAIKFVDFDTNLNAPKLKAKLRQKDTSLLSPVDIPPAINTKNIKRQTYPARSISVVKPILSFNQTAPSLDIKDPVLSISASRGFGQNSLPISQSGGVGNTTQVGGANHCTLVAHIGPTTREVAEIEFIDCIRGDIAEAAEIELYKWVNSGADSYTKLGAQVGDAVEFIYEEKRRTASAG